MEIVKNVTLFTTIVLLGLSAGLFYAWEVSVIPGTKKVSDSAYLETMQLINREILNPKFFLSFIGSLLLLVISSYFQFNGEFNDSFWLMIAATLSYLVGTFGVTAFGNVPLNDMLDAIKLDNLSPAKMQELRQSYEGSWNRLHTTRTLFSILSFSLALLAIFVRHGAAEKTTQSIF